MTQVKVGDVVCLKSDMKAVAAARSGRKFLQLMTVEGPARYRSDQTAIAMSTLKTRETDVSVVWIDENGNVLHDDIGVDALSIVK